MNAVLRFFASVARRPLVLGLLVVLAGTGWAVADPRARAALQRPFGAAGVVVVPDHYLRPWDPVTVFFPSASGPAGGGPEDHPERLVKVAPAVEGAWEWLDARTLQFRPAEPWPTLGLSRWRVGGEEIELVTLMAPPLSTVPAAGATDLPPVEAMTLVFANEVDVAALADMVSFELTPLDGSAGARWLGSRDFVIKALPAESPVEVESTDTGSQPEPAGPGLPYEIRFKEPIPLGTQVSAHFRLSRDDTTPEGFADVRFATSEPFRVAEVGCAGTSLPVASAGTRYSAEQVRTCPPGPLWVAFTAAPEGLGPVEARNLVRFSPAVEGLEFSVSGQRLLVSGRFQPERAYEVTVSPTALKDTAGRPLVTRGASRLFLRWNRAASWLRWSTSDGLVEREGPQMLPVDARGESRVDLRVVKVDPLDRAFWPFPGEPVSVDESARPPGPGEEPAEDDVDAVPSPEILGQRLQLMGPAVSTLVDLPSGLAQSAGHFGLDLAPHFARVSGRSAPGTYLVGLRTLDTSSTRSWMRVQVTDLSLTAVDEAGAVRFIVTSLATGAVVSGAEVRLEGLWAGDSEFEWKVLSTGNTGPDGSWTWTAPGEDRTHTPRLRRVVVSKGADVLVLNPSRPPMVYTENHWGQEQADWFGWAYGPLARRVATGVTLAHLFTERPVYRPEETVHIKGWLRRRDKGVLSPVATDGVVVVTGPGELAWRSATLTTSPSGGFYFAFSEAEAPTGTYYAHFETPSGDKYGSVSFQLEAYRLPEFEAVLSSADSAPLDRPFEVKLTASYFAGGRVSGRPVRWRVTQFPYDWTLSALPGFLYSSDGRWSGVDGFRATPRFEKVSRTDADGGATITLDPTIEPTATPRTYVVEATVTGADEQTVTAVRRVVSLPPFVLGLKLPRYVENATVLHPEILVAGVDQKLLAGQEVIVRLKRRTWQSVLQAGDFSNSSARYLTDVVDVPVSEQTVTSGRVPTVLDLPIDRAGVYLVELEARDRLGRAQVVRADLYAGGSEAVSWPKPAAGVFSLATDRSSYDPGSTASIVVQSPFATAEALVIVEAPGGNVYSRVPVRGGTATIRLPIEKSWVPNIPVHVLLLRGRTEVRGTAASPDDLGKPITLASSTSLVVNPVENRLVVGVENPARAMPGQTVPVTVRLRTPAGKPVGGEVTLWLVDAAVLSLGKEQRLDPLPDFITAVRSRLSLRDTRNLAFGRIPFAELPGGDDAATEEESPLDRATIRKDFKPVPYYQPALKVGADGNLTVNVKLPDNLTTFRIRAKAVAGPDRAGHGVSEIAVRLPVLVQPALPRFVRPGDSFAATGVGRVVEGAGGAGTAQIRVEGLKLSGSDKAALTLSTTEPARVRFPVVVETPTFGKQGKPVRESVVIRMAVSRGADGASDAFEVRLPVREDRVPEVERQLLELVDGKSVAVKAIAESARPGTIARTWLASDELGVLRVAAGLDWLERFPYGNTEARVSRGRAWLALGSLRGTLGLEDGEARTERAVASVLAWLPQVMDGSGLIADVPGGVPSVARTAWTEQFLVEAREAGFAVDVALERTLVDALRQALRSDYAYFAPGERDVERALALEALAAAGKLDAAYFAELARTAQFRDAEGVAAVTLAGARGGQGGSAVEARLVDMLSGGLVTRLWQGREVYGGLQTQRLPRSGRVIPSETRTLALMTRAIARARPDHPRLPLMVEGLVSLGRADGWGTTNANAEAILALVARLKDARPGSWTAEVRGTADNFTLTPSPGAVAHVRSAGGDAASVTARGAALGLWVQTAYVPSGDGATVAARGEGLVVSRDLQLVASSGPSNRLNLSTPGMEVAVALGQVVEEHVQLVVPADVSYVALVVPLAAGVDPLNPRLATAPPEARPSGTSTGAATWADWRDDRVTFFFEALPKGTYDVYFRTRATTPGRFVMPPATAELLYDRAVRGRSAGARLVVSE